MRIYFNKRPPQWNTPPLLFPSRWDSFSSLNCLPFLLFHTSLPQPTPHIIFQEPILYSLLHPRVGLVSIPIINAPLFDATQKTKCQSSAPKELCEWRHCIIGHRQMRGTCIDYIHLNGILHRTQRGGHPPQCGCGNGGVVGGGAYARYQLPLSG